MKTTTAQKWRRILAWLRREFPPQLLVTVRSVPLKDLHGDAFVIDRVFRIRINRKKSFNIRIDTIIHEWAHILTWFGAEETADHSGEWGLTYARIYRAYIEWNFGEKEENEEM